MDKELQFLIYNTPEENVSVIAVIKDETILITEKAVLVGFKESEWEGVV